jgi:hypothetical protein
MSVAYKPAPELKHGHERRRAADQQIAYGYDVAAPQIPPSWAGPTSQPQQGATCSCCRGGRWWREAYSPNGWRCWMCHPPDHLPNDAVMEIRT